MNLPEFKAWFEGFTEAMTGPPNKTQWKRIQAKIAEITPNPTPWPVFVREYVPHYWPTLPVYPNQPVIKFGAATSSAQCNNGASLTVEDAFRAMGQMDAIQ